MIEIKNNRYVRVRVAKQQHTQSVSDIMNALALPRSNIIDVNPTQEPQNYSDDGLCILGTELTKQQLIAFFDYMAQVFDVDLDYASLELTYANGYTCKLYKNVVQFTSPPSYSTALLVSIVFNSHEDEIQPE